MPNQVQYIATGQPLDFAFFWNQFHSVLGAIAIFIIGYIIALILSGGVKKLLEKGQINQRYAKSTARGTNLEQILSRVVFWFILVIAIIAGLNVLNLDAVSAPLGLLIGKVLAFLPNLLAAAGVAFVGWLVATLARSLINGALARTQLDDKLSEKVGVTPISQHIAEIVYWFVLLIFLTMVLSILGLNGLLAPLQVMMTKAIGFIPNLVMAGIIIFVGYIVAKILRGIVEGLVSGFGLQEKMQQSGSFKQMNLPKLLGSFVFAIVIITTLIIAFDTLGVQAITQPATAMLNQIMAAIPNILAAGIILTLAYVVSRFVAQLATELLSGAGADELPAKLDIQRFLGEKKLSSLAGSLIVFFTMLFATIEAANRLQFGQLSNLITMFIRFGANILLGAVIMVVGFWLANTVAKVVERGEYNSSRWLASLIRVLIMGLVLAMGLNAMGIADSIVNLAFGLTLGGVAVAFALAFGLGGRAPAERLLNRLVNKVEKEASQPNLQAAFDQTTSSPIDIAVDVLTTKTSNVESSGHGTTAASAVLSSVSNQADEGITQPHVHVPSAVADINLHPENQADATLTQDKPSSLGSTVDIDLKPKDWKNESLSSEVNSNADFHIPKAVSDIDLHPTPDANTLNKPE